MTVNISISINIPITIFASYYIILFYIQIHNSHVYLLFVHRTNVTRVYMYQKDYRVARRQ